MKLTWHAEVTDQMTEQAMNGVEKLGYEIQSLSQTRCPVDTGTLRGSARLVRESNKVSVGYGGAAASYSIEQHENLQIHHRVGQAKFLESAFDELKGKLKEYVKAAVR